MRKLTKKAKVLDQNNNFDYTGTSILMYICFGRDLDLNADIEKWILKVFLRILF